MTGLFTKSTNGTSTRKAVDQSIFRGDGTVSDYTNYALSVPCPTCGARRGLACTTKRKAYHINRADAGIRRAMRATYAEHERAMRALSSVRADIAAGRDPKYREINSVLACACEECLRSNVELGGSCCRGCDA